MDIIPESVFEFNNLPVGNAANEWFKTWFDSMKPKFKASQEKHWRDPSLIEKVAQLFKESMEVSLRMKEHKKSVCFRIAEKKRSFFGWTALMKSSKHCSICRGPTQMINSFFI